MPQKSELTLPQCDAIKILSCREAARLYRISFKTWKRIKEGGAFEPSSERDSRRQAEAAEALSQSCREAPHLNTQERARRLGLRVETAQRILKRAGLNKLHARLAHAGYQVEVVRPLQIARMRRIVATYPGSLTHIDFKSFGFLRRERSHSGIRVGGYCCIDSLTSFATIHLASTPNPTDAIKALEKHREKAPFALEGIVLSDNGCTDFITDRYLEHVTKSGLFPRTTKRAHPWSNGKVEALNKTLKYQCFPAIAYAKLDTLEELSHAVELWMNHYNKHRSHTGHVNRGLPPLAFFDLLKRTPGDHFEKLITLGILELDSEWTWRTMGEPGNAGERPGDHTAGVRNIDRSALPSERTFALILERTRTNKSFITNNTDESKMTVTPPAGGLKRIEGTPSNRMILNK